MTHARTHAAPTNAPPTPSLARGRGFGPSGTARARGRHSFGQVTVGPTSRTASNGGSTGGQGAPIQRYSILGQFRNFRRMLRSPVVGPLPQGNRQVLDDHLRQFGRGGFFTEGLRNVNRRYALGTNEPLPNAKLNEYTHLSTQVEGGHMSDRSAFLRSAGGWARHGHVPGTLANLAGGTVAPFVSPWWRRRR